MIHPTHSTSFPPFRSLQLHTHFIIAAPLSSLHLHLPLHIQLLCSSSLSLQFTSPNNHMSCSPSSTVRCSTMIWPSRYAGPLPARASWCNWLPNWVSSALHSPPFYTEMSLPRTWQRRYTSIRSMHWPIKLVEPKWRVNWDWLASWLRWEALNRSLKLLIFLFSIVYANQLNRCPLHIVVGSVSMQRSVVEGVVPISNYLSMIIK